MANMSYCRFQNTLADLRDCHTEMNDYMDIDDMELSEAEKKAMHSLIRLCKRIAEENE